MTLSVFCSMRLLGAILLLHLLFSLIKETDFSPPLDLQLLTDMHLPRLFLHRCEKRSITLSFEISHKLQDGMLSTLSRTNKRCQRNNDDEEENEHCELWSRLQTLH